MLQRRATADRCAARVQACHVRQRPGPASGHGLAWVAMTADNDLPRQMSKLCSARIRSAATSAQTVSAHDPCHHDEGGAAFEPCDVAAELCRPWPCSTPGSRPDIALFVNKELMALDVLASRWLTEALGQVRLTATYHRAITRLLIRWAAVPNAPSDQQWQQEYHAPHIRTPCQMREID